MGIDAGKEGEREIRQQMSTIAELLVGKMHNSSRRFFIEKPNFFFRVGFFGVGS